MFEMQSPLKPQINGIILLNQAFGTNANNFYKELGMIGHNGLDMYTQNFGDGNAPVTAAHDGYVISDASKDTDASGRRVWIISDEVEIDGRKCKVKTVYFHLKSARVSTHHDLNNSIYFDRYNQDKHKGKYWVRAGSEVGIANNTGKYTTGAHLHFGMYICWKRADGSYIEDTGNGYGGAVNPQLYLLDDFVYQLPIGIGNGYYWKNGKLITRAELDDAISPYLKEQADNYYTSYKAAKLFLSSLYSRYLATKS